MDRLVFTLDLEVEGQEPLYFTLRARANIATPWIWVHTQTGLNDGQILFHLPQVAIGIDCAPYFHSLFSFTHPAVQVKTVVSQVSGVDVFEISAVAPADCWSTVVLGEPLSLERFYALVKFSWKISSDKHILYSLGKIELTLDGPSSRSSAFQDRG